MLLISRQPSGEAVMAWIIAILALGLLMTALTVMELRQPVRASVIKFRNFTVADRVITVFVIGTFTVAFVSGLIVLASTVLE
jgi:hypothetical protein